jgi:hypothetical protein
MFEMRSRECVSHIGYMPNTYGIRTGNVKGKRTVGRRKWRWEIILKYTGQQQSCRFVRN